MGSRRMQPLVPVGCLVGVYMSDLLVRTHSANPGCECTLEKFLLLFVRYMCRSHNSSSFLIL